MITHKQLVAVMGVFGLAVIASGLIRYFFSADPSTNGLYFGLVVGGIALVGASLALVNLVQLARLVAGFAAAVAILWFGYDMFRDLSNNFKITEAEIRKTIIVVLGVATAVAICLPIRNATAE